jgi:hypothetical protein
MGRMCQWCGGHARVRGRRTLWGLCVEEDYTCECGFGFAVLRPLGTWMMSLLTLAMALGAGKVALHGGYLPNRWAIVALLSAMGGWGASVVVRSRRRAKSNPPL